MGAPRSGSRSHGWGSAPGALRAYVETLPRVERVELLPYHTLGVGKYAALGRPYSLNGVSDMDKARCAALEVKWFQPWNRRV